MPLSRGIGRVFGAGISLVAAARFCCAGVVLAVGCGFLLLVHKVTQRRFISVSIVGVAAGLTAVVLLATKVLVRPVLLEQKLEL